MMQLDPRIPRQDLHPKGHHSQADRVSELNQIKLLSYCGLNIVKHKEIPDDTEAQRFIEKFSEDWGTKIGDEIPRD